MHRVIIGAFFDCMTPEPVDYLALREREMQLPPRQGKRRNVPRVLVVGQTAAGKSRLMQHLLQTTRENFPMRGAGRTTVADTEVIVDDVDYAGVVTFYAENEIREIIKENILEACEFAYREPDDKAKIAAKLLIDSDKRFRFNHVIGDWDQSTDAVDDEDDVEDQSDELEADAPAPLPWPKLESCVAQVVAMTEHALAAARLDLQAEKEQDEQVIEEYWLQYIDHDQLDALTEEILEEIERRLCAATGQSSWPITHRIPDTTDRAEFFRRLRPFYQNNRKLFGALVTPLVQGLRVRGRFAPPTFMATTMPSWVLLDGQGLGHEQGRATKINRTVPPELAKKFSSADLILLVDRAVPAMTGEAPILLENLIDRGHQDQLAIVFTHFEDVAAPDLNLAGRKAKVLEGLSNAIQAIAALPKAQRVQLERTAESKTYFLARMDRPEVTQAADPSRTEASGRAHRPQRRRTGTPPIPATVQRIRDRERPRPRDPSIPAGLERRRTRVVPLEDHGGTHELDRPRLEQWVSKTQPVPRTRPRATPRESRLERAGITRQVGSPKRRRTPTKSPASSTRFAATLVTASTSTARKSSCTTHARAPGFPPTKTSMAAAPKCDEQEPSPASWKTARNYPMKDWENSPRTSGKSSKTQSNTPAAQRSGHGSRRNNRLSFQDSRTTARGPLLLQPRAGNSERIGLAWRPYAFPQVHLR